MIRNCLVIGIIPARSGSKGIPNKNIYPLLGRPLVTYTINTSISARLLDDIYVTTDDPKIKQIANASGLKVINRPSVLASDDANMVDVAIHASSYFESLGKNIVLVLLQPTSPFRRSEDIDNAIKKYFSEKAGSIISVTESKHVPFKDFVLEKGQLVPLFSRGHLGKQRQEFPQVLQQNGSIYVVSVEDLSKEHSFYVPRVIPYMMPEELSIDIDTVEDIYRAESIIRSGMLNEN